MHVSVGFSLDAIDPNIGIEKENGRIALKAEHPIVAEGVVFCAKRREIGIFDRANTENMSKMLDLFLIVPRKGFRVQNISSFIDSFM